MVDGRWIYRWIDRRTNAAQFIDAYPIEFKWPIQLSNCPMNWIDNGNLSTLIDAYRRLSTLIDALSNNLWFQSNPRMNRRPLYCYIALWLLSFSNSQWQYIIFEELSKAGPTKFAKLQRVTVSQIALAFFKFFKQHLKLLPCLLYIQI